MRVIYGLMFFTMALVVIELVRNLKATKTCIRIATEKIKQLKKILEDYGDL